MTTCRPARRISRCLQLSVVALLLSCQPKPEPNGASVDLPTLLASGHWHDLTHAFSADTIYWPTAEGFEHRTEFEGTTELGYYYASYRYAGSEHGGTHLDAPIHFAERGATTEAIPLSRLIAPAVVVDVSTMAADNTDYQIGVQDLARWEREHGTIAAGHMVLFNTGWHQRWPNRQAYLGTAERGQDAVAKLHFPGLSPEAARWLVDQREVAAVGIDTASIDYGQSKAFLSHRILFEQDIPAFENVANMTVLPARGAFVFALPMKIAGGSGGPLRIVAWVPQG